MLEQAIFTARAADGTPVVCTCNDVCAHITVQGDTAPTYLELAAPMPFACDGSEYVLLPACCYAGNQFDVLKKPYPPLFTVEEARTDLPVTITDVPRLEKDGSGSIEVTTGDVSVPCIGVWSRAAGQAVLLFTVQQVNGANLGLVYEMGKMLLRTPFYREKAAYRWPFLTEPHDTGRTYRKGECVEIPYRLFVFDCDSLEQFYRVFFERRKCMGLDDTRPPILPFARQWEIQRDKFNYLNWYPIGGFYGHTSKADGNKAAWQPGWCGGGLSSYALLKLGGAAEQERALATLAHMFRTQAPCGFLLEAADETGAPLSCGFGTPGTEHWHLVRESGDALYSTCKHFSLLTQRGAVISPVLISGAKKLADAFVHLWEQEGQFGQFVDLATGALAVGGSTAGAIVPAALCRAAQWFGEARYLDVACAAAQAYYARDAANGYTTGGPGEILQCPDSESCFGLLESMVMLHRQTRSAHWLAKAQHLAHMCASWTVAYNYRFPEESEFARLGMKSVGAVFANAQNKHAAPGICTLSGDSLHYLWQETGDVLYKELFEDIVLTVSQYMSTDARPIYSWDVPKDASLLDDDTIAAPRERLLPGYICERVNLSDWETARCIGGVFNGSCWSETANLLVLAESAPLADTANTVWLAP